MPDPIINQSQLPKLPRLEDLLGAGPVRAGEQTLYDLLRAPQGRMTDILPQMEDLLIGAQAPAMRAIQEGSRQNAAIMQSEAMKRGLTGSDIELANIRGAYETGTLQSGQLLAQQSSALAQFLMQAMGMDIASNREQFVTLAQAIGEQLAGERDMEIARRQQEFAAHEGAASRRSSLWGSLIGAGGMIGAGAMISDAALKTDFRKLGQAGGMGIYRYRWNDTARRLFGKEGESVGVLAQEVAEKYPRLVSEREGFKMVDFSGLPPVVQLEIDRLSEVS